MTPTLSILEFLRAILPREGLGLFLQSLFSSIPAQHQTKTLDAYQDIFSWALEQKDSQTLLRLRQLRNSAICGLTEVTLLNNASTTRERLIDLLLDDARFNRYFRTLQTPLSNQDLHALTSSSLHPLILSMVAVVARRSIHRGWMKTLAEAKEMGSHLEAMINQMFACVSDEWTFFDTLGEFVNYLELEFGKPSPY
jgi:hypothetical protein